MRETSHSQRKFKVTVRYITSDPARYYKDVVTWGITTKLNNKLYGWYSTLLLEQDVYTKKEVVKLIKLLGSESTSLLKNNELLIRKYSYA